MKYKIGVDCGGTFTDLVCMDEEGKIKIAKASSTPEDPSIAIKNVLDKAGIDLHDVVFFAHGATVGANTLIEKKGAKTAIITTAGFGDLIEIRKGARAASDPLDMYDMQMDLPQDYVGGYSPLVERPLRFEVPERLDYRGMVVKQMDEDTVTKIADEIAEKNVEAVAVCYLYSFINPMHEQRTAEILRERLPHLRISLSHEILPIIREYERLSTTVANAYIMPIMQNYLSNLRDNLSSLGFNEEFYIMQSGGGIMSSTSAGKWPVYTIDSGPAAGVTAAAMLGKKMEYPNILYFDMGGTTAKVCVIRDYQPAITTQFWADGKYFIGAPIVDMVEIGAGGGSIVWLDSAGSVHIGPQSAGANPGPACYNAGGANATITDADLALGYINPDYFLGGEMQVDINASIAAIQKNVACKLDISVEEAAFGVYRLANANMLSAMRVVTVQRGYDPREFAMVVSGGTAAIHAVRMAQELHVPKVVFPMTPGTYSALGLVTADVRCDLFRSYVTRSADASIEMLMKIYNEMEQEGLDRVSKLGFKHKDILLRREIAMRYIGQAHEVTFEIPLEQKFDSDFIVKAEELFHKSHLGLFGHSSPATPTEIVTLSLSATGPLAADQMFEIQKGSQSPEQAFKKTRKAYFDKASGFVDCQTYERSLLRAGNEINGPAIIEQMDTTIVIPPRQRASVDQFGNIIVYVED